ncbi:MAG: phenylalanine--tRNA ligase subunit beta, partial [Spirochaetes bacterium]|nr:phenylalanine--tRNA ligase subunit beta [Spirochaetota bacterium]
MKVSYEWLKEFVDINEDPKKVADTITMAGLEVEKIINTGIGKANVVAVEIIDIQKHSQADKLFVTRVDAGKFGKKQIVTNVTGLQKGQKIIAALEGAKLASGIEIKNTKLKGIESQGMFVGWEELGVPQKSEDL